MEFHGRSKVLSGRELAELVAISPDDDAMRLVSRGSSNCRSQHIYCSRHPQRAVRGRTADTASAGAWSTIRPRPNLQALAQPAGVLGARSQGFKLQDPEVDDVIRTARDLEASLILPDASLPAEGNLDLVLRTARMLQLGLEVQFMDNEGLIQENNGLRDEVKVCSRMPGAACMQAPWRLCGAAGEQSMWRAPRPLPTPLPLSGPQTLEEHSRDLEGEIMELREIRDQETNAGDIKELERELRVGRWSTHNPGKQRRRRQQQQQQQQQRQRQRQRQQSFAHSLSGTCS
jgi:hypothetical protein